jgi:cell division protein FtsL
VLSVTVRFYTTLGLTGGGFSIAIVYLAKISYKVGQIRQSFDDHVTSDDRRFSDHEADIRELRAGQRSYRRGS